MTDFTEVAEQKFKTDVLDYASRPYQNPYSQYTVDPNTLDVVKAWWRQETLLGDAVSFLNERTNYYSSVTGTYDEADKDFNPFSYFERHKTQYLDVGSYLTDGHFNHVLGPKQFEAVANSIREENKRRKIMEEGGAAGTILGMAASILDPSTLIPIFGVGSKLNVARKALATGLSVGGVIAGEEAIHHTQQRSRTLQESLFAIGVGTSLGTGLGAIGGMIARKGALIHPDNPKNPLKVENFKPDEEGSEFAHELGMSTSEHLDSINTGSRMKYDPDGGVTLETTKVDKAMDWTQDKLGFLRTPMTVAMRTSSDVARRVLFQLFDNNAYTKEMRDGAARLDSVESLKNISVYTPQNVAEETFINAWYKMMKSFGHNNEYLAKLGSDITEMKDFVTRRGTASLDTDVDNLKGLTLSEFNELVWRRTMGDTNAHRLPAVEKAIKEAVAGPQKFFRMMYERMVKAKMLQENQEIKNYFPQIWNTSYILEHGRVLKEAFKVKFAKRFDDEAMLDKFADDLVEKLSNRHDGELLDGMVRGKEFVLKGGDRVKAREIFIEPEELDLFSEFLEKDLSRVMKQYADDAGGRLAIREFFGAVDEEDIVKTKTKKGEQSFDDLSKVWKDIQKDFAEKRKEARAKGESTDKLVRDETRVKEALLNTYERLLQIDRRPSEDGWGSFALFAGRSARKVNFLRFMGSVMLASLTDAATISLSHGMGKQLSQFGKNLGRIGTEAKVMNNRELAYLLFGAEGMLSQQRTAKLMGIDDTIYQQGFGVGTTRKVSGAIENSMNWMSAKMNHLNLMSLWNSRNKFMAGHIVLGNIIDDAARVATGKKTNFKFRELGLDDDVMKRIHKLTQKHGYEEQRAGVTFRWPDTERWYNEAGGLEAVQILHQALKRATDQAVITPSIADLPMFYSKEVGQILLQFNSFGFAAVNKWMRRWNNRAVNGQMSDAFISTTWALAMGTASFAIREGIVKRRFEKDEMPPSDEWGTWVYEAIDRSGIMMWSMPYQNAILKLTSRHLKNMGVPIGAPSRFQAQSWWQQLVGPTAGGLLGDLKRMVDDFNEGDIDKLATKAKRLLPYRNVFWLQGLLNQTFKED